MRRNKLLPLLLLPLLFGCKGKNSSEVDSSKKYFIDRNGDLPATAEKYLDIAYSTTAKEAIEQAEAGSSALILFESVTCQHCETMKPDFIQFVLQSKAQVTIIERGNDDGAAYWESAQMLTQKYGEAREFGKAYPVSFLIGEKDSDEAFRGDRNKKYIENAVKEFASFTNITHFKNFEAFSAQKSEKTLSFLYDSTDSEAKAFYTDHLYPKAKLSSKPLQVIDYGYLSDEMKESFRTEFSLEELYHPILRLGEKALNLYDEETAPYELIDSYYA